MTLSVVEERREISIASMFDVIVAGGGPAGIAAAIAAARSGARTALFELHGCVGGVWTAGALSWVLEAGQPGLVQEIVQRLAERDGFAAGDGSNRRVSAFAYDVETMKLILEELLIEAGVSLRLHTRVAGAVVAGGRVQSILTESKSGREAWSARQFIDCTGDGDLAALAGCGYDYGHPVTGHAQPMSMMALLSGIDRDDVSEYILGGRGKLPEGGGPDPRSLLLKVLADVGVRPSYSGPTLWAIHDDLFALMATHQYAVSGLSAADLTDATVRGRAEVHRLVNALRSQGGVWSGIRIVATAEQIGVREGRRIHGHYTVTARDTQIGRRHKDAVCTVKIGIDVHSLTADEGGFLSESTQEIQPDASAADSIARVSAYDLPLRSLIARDVDGLLLAGRCISGDFFAHGSYRVTGSAVAMGQAAGVVAALAALHESLVQDLPWATIQEALDRFLGSGTRWTGSRGCAMTPRIVTERGRCERRGGIELKC